MPSARARGPLAVGAAWLCFATYISLTSAYLPEQVATHFGAGGRPDGWMTRAEHVRFTLIAGAAIPAVVLGVFSLIRRLDGVGLNVPHRDYWLAPERRQETFAFIEAQGIALGLLLVAFLAGAHTSILTANAHRPAYLDHWHLAWLIGAFSVAMLVWIAMFLVHFTRERK